MQSVGTYIRQKLPQQLQIILLFCSSFSKRTLLSFCCYRSWCTSMWWLFSLLPWMLRLAVLTMLHTQHCPFQLLQWKPFRLSFRGWMDYTESITVWSTSTQKASLQPSCFVPASLICLCSPLSTLTQHVHFSVQICLSTWLFSPFLYSWCFVFICRSQHISKPSNPPNLTDLRHVPKLGNTRTALLNFRLSDLSVQLL